MKRTAGGAIFKNTVCFSAAILFWVLSAISALAQFNTPEREREIADRNREIGRTVTQFPRLPGSRGLDRASLEKLQQIRRVDRDDEVKYREFLKGSNTGIFKLFPDNGCVEKGIIRVDGDCEGFVPDSNYYLFRMGKYVGYGHDIWFYRSTFLNKSFFTQSIFVSLGDEPIETASATHAAVKLLDEFQPSLTSSAVSRSVEHISKGVNSGGYYFADTTAAKINTTYAIRKIEFKAGGDLRSIRPLTGSRWETLSLNLLGLQERKDSIYVFRVIAKGEDGELTILWKQISRKKAPTIKFQKGDTFPDFGAAMDKSNSEK